MTPARNVWLPVLLSALLAGCATPGRELLTESSKALSEAPLCCTSLATALRVPLPLQPTEVVVDRTVQAFDFGGNKAFFVLYELPRFERPYGVVVSSIAAGTIEDVALFVPRMATYSADFKPVRFFDEKTLRNRGNNLERTVFFNQADATERFLAIYGSDLAASVDRAYSMVTVTPVFAGPVMFNMYGGQDGKSTLRSSPAGKLKIEVQGLTLGN